MGSFLTLVGIGASTLVSLWGMGKDKKQQEKFMERHEYEYGEGLRFREEELRMAKRKEEHEKEQAAKKWKWMEEDRNYTRGREVADRFLGLLDRGTAFENNLVNLWPKMRRAA